MRAWGCAAALALVGCSVGSGDGDGGMDAALISAEAGIDAGPQCARDIDCGDRIACTIDRCEAGRCVHDPCADCCPEGLSCIAEVGCGAIQLCDEDADCNDGVRCTLDACRDGEVCQQRPQNELCDEGESCLPILGCIPSPPTSCTTAEDCTGGDACLGEWRCEPEFGCAFVAPPDCDDGDACTTDSCDREMGMCVHPIRDADADGYGDDACGGDDCDDADPDVGPGAAEACDGAIDDDCDGTIDEGCCAAGAPCATGCGSTGAIVCESGGGTTCVPPTEVCNGVDDDCDTACDDGFACCAGSTRDCTALGFLAGTATCPSDCSGWDTSGCSNCGNGAVDAGEDCDGSNLDGNDCTSIGGSFGSGTLRCTSGCAFDTSSCSLCGNGALDSGEDCDGPSLGGATCVSIGAGTGGTLGCTTSCAYDTSACISWTPSGIYGVSPAATYTCASGLVDYNQTSFTFTDDGTTLTVTGGRCTMTGPSVPRTGTRAFSVSCVVTGTCDETYTLSGTFTTDDTWSGTYRATWTPLFAGACLDCTNQTHALTGTR